MCALRGCEFSTDDMCKMFNEMLDKSLFDIDYRSLLGIGKLPFGRFDLSHGIILSYVYILSCKLFPKGLIVVLV